MRTVDNSTPGMPRSRVDRRVDVPGDRPADQSRDRSGDQPGDRTGDGSGDRPGANRAIRGIVIRAVRARTFHRVLALATFGIFLCTAFQAGWRRAETDFPNYYTAARVVREGKPLDKYYDWTWFQREMNYGGIERQLGSYTAQTPLTMMPMVPLARLPVQRAKQVWLAFNLLFLFATLWMLSQVTKFSIELLWLLTFAGSFSLYVNFLYGQYYVFLLFLLTLTFYLLHRRNFLNGGIVAGVTFALKLYAGPLLLYFAVKRRWGAVAGMLLATAFCAAAAIAIFGLHGVEYYLSCVLPRSLEGGAIDPYNAGVPAFSTMLRRLLMKEPALNPHPLWDAPWLFFWLRTFVTLAVTAFACVGLWFRSADERKDFAWFIILVILLSTNPAPYTFILLLLPVALLLHDSGMWEGLLLVGCYVLLTLPLRPQWLFPKVWLLFALFVVVGRRYLRFSSKMVLAIVSAAAVFSFVDAARHMRQYEAEPGRRFEQVATGRDSLFSGFPLVTKFGIFYQAMTDRYVLRWIRNGRIETIKMEGHELLPVALPDGTIEFELVAHGTSVMMRFDPATGSVARVAGSVPAEREESDVLSPDGRWIAFTTGGRGQRHLWLRSITGRREILLAGGSCDSSWPAWSLDSRSLVFASDCDRGLGLPALYRASVPLSLSPSK